MNLDVDIKRKATVRISRKDLQKLLAENEQMAEQIAALQAELDALRKEHLPVKPKLEVKKKPYDPNDDETFPDYTPEAAPEDWGPGPGRSPDPNHPLPRTDIYFDDSNGFNSGRRFGSNG